jgi:S1-C subfamily serine protease
MIDTKADLAVFHADTNVPALKLAKQSVEPCNPVTVARKPCDVIFIQGFPYGLPKLVTVIGYLAARDVPILHPTYEIVMPSDILDITTAGGNSGSPVMNSKGEVIGVLWGGFIESPHSLAIPLESVRRALLGYFEN